MALCRCKAHSPPIGRTVVYIISVEPFGYPKKTSSICGRKTCKKVGLIWLTKDEWRRYQKGELMFSYATAVTKVRVQ